MPTTRPAETAPDVERREAKDAAVRDAVIDALYRRGYPALWPIQVSVKSGIVTLTGSVPSFYLRQVAQTAVLSVPGVNGVDAALEIAERFDR